MAHGHGKVILFGEHAVVYGRPAIALAIERAAVATARRTPGPTTLHVRPWNVQVDTGPAPNLGRERLQEALKALRALYCDELELDLHAEMRIPAQAGLGSSAALCLAVLRAMDEARGSARTDRECFERSFAWERVFHGDPAGVDAAMATFGGLALFRKSEPLQPIGLRPGLRLVAVDSGGRLGAREMVAFVRRQYERDRARVERAFDGIARVVEQARTALVGDERARLGQLMTENHQLLAELQLTNLKLEQMVATAIGAGALGAKLTGAGGGGCMIALANDDAMRFRLEAALEPFGRVYDVSPSN